MAIIAIGVFAISGYVGWNLTHPKREAINATPANEGLTYNDIRFKSREDNLTLSGWLLRSQENEKTVILAHGYRKNRLQNDVPALAIAKDLVSEGCNVIMFDFRNSGISDGNLTSVGQYEVQDLLGAVDYVKSQPELNQKIILMGFSMGASTAILAGAREPAVSAVIADSPFADLNTYLNENLSIWTELPSFPFNKAFFIVVPKLTGLRVDMVSPISEISNLSGRKLLLIHGECSVNIV
jgi:dipeptidyl aminopeptidase/acylaminoacyl peptidase